MNNKVICMVWDSTFHKVNKFQMQISYKGYMIAYITVGSTAGIIVIEEARGTEMTEVIFGHKNVEGTSENLHLAMNKIDEMII